jgi:hypothetical protein
MGPNVLDVTEDVLPREPTDRTGAVDCEQGVPERTEDEARRVEVWRSVRGAGFEVDAERGRDVVDGGSPGHRESDPVLGHEGRSARGCRPTG